MPVPRGLSRLQFWAILGLCLLIFFFGTGPVWTHRWAPDSSILWSYAPIPPLVLVCLAYSRRWTLGRFLGETAILASAKFGITALTLIGLWALDTPPLAEKPTLRELFAGATPSQARAPNPQASRLAPFRLEVTKTGFSPERAELIEGQPLLARSADGRLHTLHARRDGGSLFNEPVLANGQERLLFLPQGLGTVIVQCAVHPGESAELRIHAGSPGR